MASRILAEGTGASTAAHQPSTPGENSDVDQLASPSVSARQTPKHAPSEEASQQENPKSDAMTFLSSPPSSPSIHESSSGPPPAAQKALEPERKASPKRSATSAPTSSRRWRDLFSPKPSVYKAKPKTKPLSFRETKRSHFSARLSSFGNLPASMSSDSSSILPASAPITQQAVELDPIKTSRREGPGNKEPDAAQESPPPAKQPERLASPLTVGPQGAVLFNDMPEAEREEVMQCSLAAAQAGDDDIEEELRMPASKAQPQEMLPRLVSPSVSPVTPPTQKAVHQACTTTCLTCVKSPLRPLTPSAYETPPHHTRSSPTSIRHRDDEVSRCCSASGDSSISDRPEHVSSDEMTRMLRLGEMHRPSIAGPSRKRKRLDSNSKPRLSTSRNKPGPASVRQRASTIGPIAQGAPTQSATIQTSPTSLEPTLSAASQGSPAKLFAALADISNMASAKSIELERDLVSARQTVEAQRQQIERQESTINFLHSKVAWWERMGWDRSITKAAGPSQSSDAAAQSDPVYEASQP